MRDSINLGPVPAEENCEQVGTDRYDSAKARFECNVLIRQLRRMHGNEPEGARLFVKSNPHDFGTYLEVECEFTDSLPESVEYAFKCEAEYPAEWDDDARKELNERYPNWESVNV